MFRIHKVYEKAPVNEIFLPIMPFQNLFTQQLQELHPEHMRRTSSSQGTDHITLLTAKNSVDNTALQLR